VRFGDDVRFFRATAGFDALAARLALGVGYGPSTVNRHRIELFLVDARGDVAASFTRMQWDAAAVLAAAEALLASAITQQT
jgi:protein SCO1/2